MRNAARATNWIGLLPTLSHSCAGRVSPRQRDRIDTIKPAHRSDR
jgi:hypothetical protein